MGTRRRGGQWRDERGFGIGLRTSIHGLSFGLGRRDRGEAEGSGIDVALRSSVLFMVPVHFYWNAGLGLDLAELSYPARLLSAIDTY